MKKIYGAEHFRANVLKTYSRRGGKCVKQLINKWKSTSYSFKIFYHELKTSALVEENQELRGEKRKAEEDLAAEQAKRLKIEQKLENVIKDSEKSKKYYRGKFRALAKKVARMQNKGKRGPNKQTKFSEFTKQHQARIKKRNEGRLPGNTFIFGAVQFYCH